MRSPENRSVFAGVLLFSSVLSGCAWYIGSFKGPPVDSTNVVCQTDETIQTPSGIETIKVRITRDSGRVRAIDSVVGVEIDVPLEHLDFNQADSLPGYVLEDLCQEAVSRMGGILMTQNQGEYTRRLELGKACGRALWRMLGGTSCRGTE